MTRSGLRLTKRGTGSPLFGPVVLHPGWDRAGLHVLASVDPLNDERWLHVSFSRRDRIPDYEDMALIRRHFFRPESVAVQVFPPVAEHVNIHAHCLHLWERLDGPRLVPDLRRNDPAFDIGAAI